MAGPSQAYIERQRMLKACELEELAVAAGVKAADLMDADVRDKLRRALAEQRGKPYAQVHVSIDTFRVLWRLLHDRETRGRGDFADPFANIPGSDG